MLIHNYVLKLAKTWPDSNTGSNPVGASKLISSMVYAACLKNFTSLRANLLEHDAVFTRRISRPASVIRPSTAGPPATPLTPTSSRGSLACHHHGGRCIPFARAAGRGAFA